MSFTKLDPLFPGYKAEISNEKLAEIIAYSLRRDFGQQTSSIKKIGGMTDANLRTIKNWYDGLKVPSSVHFIQLLHASPTLRRFILTHMFGEEFWEDFVLISRVAKDARQPDHLNGMKGKITPNNEPINDTINLNERQKWFLLKVKNDRNKTAEDIVRHFGVSLSTAKRDIAELKKWEAIRFHGSRKTGYYEVIDLQ